MVPMLSPMAAPPTGQGSRRSEISSSRLAVASDRVADAAASRVPHVVYYAVGSHSLRQDVGIGWPLADEAGPQLREVSRNIPWLAWLPTNKGMAIMLNVVLDAITGPSSAASWPGDDRSRRAGRAARYRRELQQEGRPLRGLTSGRSAYKYTRKEQTKIY